MKPELKCIISEISISDKELKNKNIQLPKLKRLASGQPKGDFCINSKIGR